MQKELRPPLKTLITTTPKIDTSPVTMFLHPTDEREITKLINELKAKNSGQDSISNHLLKEIKEGGIIKPLTVIINESLEEGHFPSRMKIADVIPLYKSKNKTNKSNYRPICLLLYPNY